MKKSFYLSGLFVVCALLSSVIATATLPTFTTNPVADTICVGATAKFIVAANDTPDTSPITYMWQASTDGGATWSTITDTTFYSGTTNDTLSVTGRTFLDGYWYRVIATDTSGSDTSSAAALVVNSPASAITGPSIICSGSSVTLTDSVADGLWSNVNHAVDTVDPTGVVTGLSAGYDTITYTVTNACGITTATAPMRVDVSASALPITGPTATCVGHTIDLANANVTGTWTWGASNGDASIAHDGTLSGLSGGLDTISYTFTNACNTVTSSTIIEIDTLLGHGSISGPSGVCIGSGIHLSETSGGGVWISSNTDIAVIDGSGNVTGISQGAVTISYYLSNACGASIATYTVTVSRDASPISGIDSVGIGNTRLLTDSATDGVWSVSDTSIATIDPASGVATGRDTGVTTVTYTVVNACGTSFATLTLNVAHNAPYVSIIKGRDSLCIGSNITLTDSTIGGVWHSSNDTFATVDSITGVVHGVASGTVFISYTFSNAFGDSTVVKRLFVNHIPVISLTGPNFVSVGGDYFIRATPPDGTFYTSNDSVGQIISTYDSVFAGIHFATFGSFVMLTKGRDTIHYRYVGECGTVDSVFIVYLAPNNGVNTISNVSSVLNVYPNPNHGEFKLNLSSVTTESASIVVTNMVGEKVKEFTILTNHTNDIKLDDQPDGIYFLSATCSDGKYTSKITIAK